jgi:Tol biopolymer transport system component/DNA-binding winged helix-turn-helix (wHTH) protein
VIRFGEFAVDPDARELFRNGIKVKLQGQPFEILLLLLEHPGIVASREEVHRRLWPSDTFVDFEHGLNAAVNRLREALGDSADQPKFIETLPRRGYRFIGKIETDPHQQRGNQTSTQRSQLSEAAPTEPAIQKPLPASASPVRWRWIIMFVFVLLGVFAAALLRRHWPSHSRPSAQRTLTRVTFDPGLQIGVTWSPDGRYIAFASNRGGKFDIWVQQVSGGDPVQITQGAGANWEPDWSPDGKYIAYRSEEGDGGIFIEPAIGGAGMSRKISSFGHYPRWSPDGSKILFQTLRFGLTSKIFEVTIADPDLPREVLRDTTSRAYIMSSAWHPDGKRVSLWGWVVAPTPIPDFWTGLADSDGSALKIELSPEVLKIAQEVAGNGFSAWGDRDFKLSWAPNGRELYFERMLRGVRNIWRMQVDPETMRGESVERVTAGSELETEFALSPDGTKLAFTSLSEQVRTWVFPLNEHRGQITGSGAPVTSSGLEAWDGDLSPDGAKLAFCAMRAGRWEIWQKDLANGVETVVAADDAYVRLEPHWSPLGNRLAYVRLKLSTGDMQAVVYDIKTRAEVPLTEPIHPGIFVYDWAPDGKSLLVSLGNPDTGQAEVWQIPVESAPAARQKWKMITARVGYDLFQAHFSPDARWITFEGINSSGKNFQSAIYVVPAAGGEWIRVTEGAHWDDKPRWSPDGKLIYFLSEQDGFYNVYKVPFDPEKQKTIAPRSRVTGFHDTSFMVARCIPTVAIDVTRDKLMVTTSQSSGSIWVLDHANR